MVKAIWIHRNVPSVWEKQGLNKRSIAMVSVWSISPKYCIYLGEQADLGELNTNKYTKFTGLDIIKY